MPSTRPRQQTPQERIEIDHHRYRIVAGKRKGSFQAIAYLGRRLVESSTGDSVELAVESLKTSLDQRLARLREGRSGDVPSEAEFGEALTVVGAELPSSTMEVLALHSRLPGAASTLSDLARRADSDEATVAAAYARLGRRLAVLLDYAPTSEDSEQRLAPISTFATVDGDAAGSSPLLRLRPEVVAALDAIGQRRT